MVKEGRMGVGEIGRQLPRVAYGESAKEELFPVYEAVQICLYNKTSQNYIDVHGTNIIFLF